MGRWTLLLVLSACVRQEPIHLVPFTPIVLNAAPATTDDDIYAAAVWFAGDAANSDLRDHVTRVLKTRFEFVGYGGAATPAGGKRAYYHRLVIRAFEGQLWILIDCARTSSLSQIQRCSGKREETWVDAASQMARQIIDDANARAARRAARLTGGQGVASE